MATTEEIRLVVKSEMDKAIKDMNTLNMKFDESGKKAKSGTKSFLKWAGAITVGALAIRQLTKFMGSAVKSASALEEETNKFNVVFKEVAVEANKMATTLQKSYGFSELASKKLLSQTGDLLTGLGLTGEMALKMSSQVAVLGSDLASFQNLQGGAEQAVHALTKGLLGENEMMKTLGITVKETDIKNRLMLRGQHKLTGQALLQAKAMATLDIAIEQSGNAIGDTARTFNDFANVQRRVSSRMEDIKSKAGKELVSELGKLGLAFLKSSEDGGFLSKAMGVIVSISKVAISLVTNLITTLDMLTSKEREVRKESGELMNKGTLDAMQKSIKMREAFIKKLEKQGDSQAQVLMLTKALNKEKAKLPAIEAKYTKSLKKSTDQLEEMGLIGKESAESEKKTTEEIIGLAERKAQRERELAEEKKDRDKDVGENARKEAEKSFKAQISAVNQGLSLASDFTSQIGSIVSMSYANQTQALRNEQAKQVEAINARYKSEIDIATKNGEDTTDVEAQKQALIDDVNTKFEAKRKKLARKQFIAERKISIVSAIINTAQAFTKSLSAAPMPFGGILAAAAAALGAKQIQLIRQQPVPEAQEGGFIAGSSAGTLVRAGENNRSEAIVPLEDANIGGKLGGGGVTINIQNLFADDESAQKLAVMVDRELTRLQQDKNSTFADVVNRENI